MADKCDKDVRRMSLAYRDLTHLTEYVKKKIKLKGVEVLDLSYNHFLYPLHSVVFTTESEVVC